MINKVRVHGHAMNRTALGIAHAYKIMYPHATLDDLNRAFPIALNSSNRADRIFVNIKEFSNFKTQKKGNSTFEMFFFEQPEEYLKLQDGTIACMQELWVKSDFEKIVEHAKQYGIEIASFEKRSAFKKGGFRLEYLNGYVPPIPEKKKSKWWL
jgi:hypothetical protein